MVRCGLGFRVVAELCGALLMVFFFCFVFCMCLFDWVVLRIDVLRMGCLGGGRSGLGCLVVMLYVRCGCVFLECAGA